MEKLPEIKRESAVKLVKRSTNEDSKVTAMNQILIEGASTKALLEAKEWGELIDMRRSWSKNILLLVVFIVLSDVGFMWCLGLGWLSYPNSLIIPTFIGDSLIKTIGLAFIIVHFLFNKDSMKK